MRHLTVVKVIVKDGIIDIEGIDFIMLSPQEEAVLKKVVQSEQYKRLTT